MSIIDGYREAFEAFVTTLEEPASVTEARRAAFERFAASGLPTRRQEDWRYTPTGTFGKEVFRPGGAVDEAAIDALVAEATLGDEIALVVLVGGRLDLERSDLKNASVAKFRVRPLREAWDSATEAQVFQKNTAGFDALRDAFTADGVVIDYKSDVVPRGPIHVIHVNAPTDGPALAAARVVLRGGSHNEATLVESHVAAGEPTLFLGGAVIRFGDDAIVDHVRLQSLPLNAGRVVTDDVIVPRDGTYRSFAFTIGAALSRDDTNVRVEGPGAHTDLGNISMVGSNQLIDHHTSLDHKAPNCTADQYYKNILEGDGHAVFNGKVYVRKAAQKTSAEQLNQNLMLSERSQIDTKPQLEIFADDVRCTHGATVGQIEPEELFYMMSRAIPEEVARRMVVGGFADEAVQRIRHAGALARARALLEERLGQMTGA